MGTKITLAIWALLLIIGGSASTSWFMSKHIYKCNPESVDLSVYQDSIYTRGRLIDSLTYANIELENNRLKSDSIITRISKSRQYITIKYKELRDEVYNTHDTNDIDLQHIILSRYEQLR